MTYEELSSHVEHAVLCANLIAEIDDRHADLGFDAELLDFLGTAKALHTKVASISLMGLSESAFLPCEKTYRRKSLISPRLMGLNLSTKFNRLNSRYKVEAKCAYRSKKAATSPFGLDCQLS